MVTNYSNVKSLGEGVYEYKIDFDQDGEELVILVGGGSKKQQDKKSKSLQRMFSASGNPTAQLLFSVIHALQEAEGIKLTVSQLH